MAGLDAGGNINDWVVAPAPTAEPKAAGGVDDWVTAPAAPAEKPAIPQMQIQADINAAGQGLVGGTGAVVAGVGRRITAAAAGATQAQLSEMNAIDAGVTIPIHQDPLGYQDMTPEQRTQARADLAAADTTLAKREPNSLTTAGTAVQDFAQTAFPVAPENEGLQTGAARLVGNLVPAVAATAAGTAAGGPAGGVLAMAGVIGAQTYEGVYKEATAKGVSPEQAEDAAGKSAMAQIAAMVVPVGKVLPLIPVPLREGFVKTLVNLSQRGIEFGAGNALGTFANNYVAKESYDPDRPLTQGVMDAGAEGMIAGLVIRGSGTAYKTARATAAPKAIADIAAAPDIDTAIAAAGKAAAGQPEPAPEPAWRDLFPAREEAASAPAAADWVVSPTGEVRPAEAAPPTADAAPKSAGAAASRDLSAAADLATPPAEFAANRLQGEVERLASPPARGDATEYIPGVKPTLAEVSGDPRAAMDQAYNRQQPEAMAAHDARESQTADLVADYFADTAGSAPELLRMERAKDVRAQENIAAVFGPPEAVRPPADATLVVDGIDQVLAHPRQQERDAVRSLLTNLRDRFFDKEGALKTDPYSLYGIRDHIGDLLNGVGNTETSSAARVIERELMQIREGVDKAIEAAVPGFAKFREEYSRDSGEISAMKMLQEARLSLLSGTRQHITPAKWFNFMRGIVEGRSDPFDPAHSLSEAQMDRLWNITDQLKRQTLLDAGKPRGSWTSMMQEWGGRFARFGAHAIAGATVPLGIGNVMVEMGVAGLRKASVAREMNRVLNPDLSSFHAHDLSEGTAPAAAQAAHARPAPAASQAVPPAPIAPRPDAIPDMTQVQREQAAVAAMKARREAAKPHAEPASKQTEAASDGTAPPEIADAGGGRREFPPQPTGKVDTASGPSVFRRTRQQDWEPGNVVDVGFIKGLTVIGKTQDGFLLRRADAKGEPTFYETVPHGGVARLFDAAAHKLAKRFGLDLTK